MITHIALTLDTHQATQIFHPVFLVDDKGEHPPPYTLVSAEDIIEGRWKFNQILAEDMGVSPDYGQLMLEHYTRRLGRKKANST